MHEGRSVFAEIIDRIPWRKFQKIIDNYQGDHHVTNLKTSVLFRVLAFAQLARKVSFHMGMKSVSLNNVSNALRQRNWQIFADMGYFLIDEARKNYQKESRDPDLSTRPDHPYGYGRGLGGVWELVSEGVEGSSIYSHWLFGLYPSARGFWSRFQR